MTHTNLESQKERIIKISFHTSNTLFSYEIWIGCTGPRHKAFLFITKSRKETGIQSTKPVISEKKKIGELNPKGKPVLM